MANRLHILCAGSSRVIVGITTRNYSATYCRSYMNLSVSQLFRAHSVTMQRYNHQTFPKQQKLLRSVENCQVDTRRSLSWSSFFKDRRFALSSAGAAVATQVETAPKVENYIPEPPLPPTLSSEASELAANAEPAFTEIGLGGWSPVGLIQHAFEYVHVTAGLPWWACILLGTVTVRVLLFPLVIKAQQNAAKMANNVPQMQVLQLKMTQARQSGNTLEAARYAQELMAFMKEKDISPLKNLMVPLLQAPVFVSFFMALRGMANTPVESMKEGGLFWFTDLTVPDPYYLLPVITSATLWLTLELGADAAKLNAQNMHLMKYFFRAMPLIVFPFTVNFPGAILCYWASTNFISLIQVGFLRIPSVRAYFNIEAPRQIDPSTLPIKNKGFTEGFKESWTNMKITRELEERERINEMQFRKAGAGPVVKTYKYDPTRQNAPITTQKIVQAGLKQVKK